MKLPALILTIFMAAAVAAGQVLTAKDDISAEKYFAAEKKAEELLKTANYRSVWTKEYFADRSKAAELEEKKLYEVLHPDKWRSVDEIFVPQRRREEIISDGKAYYFRTNDRPWSKGGLGNGSASRSESGQVKNQYRYLPEVDLGGKKAELYELISIRTANKYYSQTEFRTVRYIRTTRIWYSDGKILKKSEETTVEGREEMLIEVTTYEYDPKDLTIEAPIM